MAAKGAVAKQAITQQIMEAFPNAFVHEKDIRIPWVENGETVEIKIAMTCAKVNVGGNLATMEMASTGEVINQPTEMTDAEVENVRILMDKLGL